MKIDVLPIFFAVLLTCMATFPINCRSEDRTFSEAQTVQHIGQPKKMGEGIIQSWIMTDSKGIPLSLGITLTEAALSGLPANSPSGSSFPTIEYEIALPEQITILPYKHIVVDWNPKGHIPIGVYDVPHFDFHFFMITPGERYRITAKGEDSARSNKKLPKQYTPSGYFLPRDTEEARMGSHWIYQMAPEFFMQSFTKTFVYGSYNGELIFLEPMVALSFLRLKQNTTHKIKLPFAYKEHGYYPTAYSIKYNQTRREYSVSLEGLIFR